MSMTAREFTPVERLDRPPDGPYVDAGDRESALSDALRGVDLGSYDELVAGWLVRHLDNTTLRVAVSLIERVRVAGVAEALAVENTPAPHQRPRGASNIDAPGNSGPGW